MHYISEISYFPNNDKSYKRDFFTINTVNHGLSFRGIKDTLLFTIFGLVVQTISTSEIHVDQTTWSHQHARTARE